MPAQPRRRDESQRPARVADVHRAALSMPHVTVENADSDHPVYQVGRRSFVYFRTPRPDARDEHGEKLTDVIMVWVPDLDDKVALLSQAQTPLFTTAHFDGHPSVLVQASRLGELSRAELRELVQEAWLAQASPTRQRRWLTEQGLS